MTTRKDLTGRRYGKLTVIENAGRDRGGNVLWRCECDCGGERIARSGQLGEGKAISCGCHSIHANKKCKQCGKVLKRSDHSPINWKRLKFCNIQCRHEYNNKHGKKKEPIPRDTGPRRPSAIFTDIHHAIIYGRTFAPRCQG